MAVTAATTNIPPRTPIRCERCGQILAWRLVKSRAVVPLIAAKVTDESPETIRLECHGCLHRTRVKVVEAA